jgi:hypothetical protein
VRDYGIDHTHLKSLLSGVVAPQEEDFARFFLSYHFGQIGRTITGIKAGYIGIGLLKDGMFSAG